MAEFKPDTLAVVTLTRTLDYTRRLTSGLDAQEDAPAFERVLVNNAAARARSGYHPITAYARQHQWAVVEPGYNTSFSEGNNLGAKAAPESEYLLLLNDDLIPRPDFIARLWDARKQADVVGALILHTGNETVNHAGTRVYPWPDHIGRNEPSMVWQDHQPFQFREAVTFAAALVWRPVWERLQGLATCYRYSFEDTDFCLRAIESGAKIGVALDAVAFHDECGTRERHGAADQTNAQTYRERWPEHAVKVLTDSYWERLGLPRA